MIVDGEMVITGSFNFTKALEESSVENLLIIHNKKLVSFYKKNWQGHTQHSGVTLLVDRKGWYHPWESLPYQKVGTHFLPKSISINPQWIADRLWD
jgi:phosphatidylserine/phosphatidylglycerophosphate/cardiolipin synthase-like enzyme